jgi:uncharacterized protein (DUF58 family)
VTFLEWYAALEADVVFSTRALLRTMTPGEHRTGFGGRGFQVRHHAEYRQGDDRRLVDWKLSQKAGHLLVKRFAHEGQLPVVVACDVSRSMAFGTRQSKWELMLRILGVVGLATVAQLDSLHVVLFSDRVERDAHVGPGRGAVLRLLESLWQVPEADRLGAETCLVPLFERVIMRAPALVFVVSDFRAVDDWKPYADAVAFKHDVVPVLVRDEGERTLPRIGAVRVRDLETGEELLLDTTSRAHRAYFEAEVARSEREIIAVLERLGGEYLVASSDSDVVGDLVAIHHRRKLSPQLRGRSTAS